MGQRRPHRPLDAALAQLPERRAGPGAGPCRHRGRSKAFLHHITDLGLEYSIGFPGHETVKAAIEAIPEQAWRAAVDGDGEPRDGAQVAELTAWMPAPTKRTGTGRWRTGRAGMRVIARRERPHPGAQLRLTDHERVADHLLRHQHPRTRLDDWPTSRSGTANAPAARTASAA